MTTTSHNRMQQREMFLKTTADIYDNVICTTAFNEMIDKLREMQRQMGERNLFNANVFDDVNEALVRAADLRRALRSLVISPNTL